MDGIKRKAKFMNDFSKIQPRIKNQSELVQYLTAMVQQP